MLERCIYTASLDINYALSNWHLSTFIFWFNCIKLEVSISVYLFIFKTCRRKKKRNILINGYVMLCCSSKHLILPSDEYCLCCCLRFFPLLQSTTISLHKSLSLHKDIDLITTPFQFDQ